MKEDTFSTQEMATQTQKYQQAAVTYLIYGLIYLGGAVYLAEVDVVARSGWVWFLVGVVFLLVLPPLIWKGFKWVTRILAVLIFVRVIGLLRVIVTNSETVPVPWGGTMRMAYGAVVFLVVAVAAGVMLVRAGWNLGQKKSAEAGPPASSDQ